MQLGQGLLALAAICWLAHWVTRRFLVVGIERLVRRSETGWDDALHDEDVFGRLSGLIPALLVWFGAALIPDANQTVQTVVSRVAFAAMVLVGSRSLMALLTATNVIYENDQRHQNLSIKGYVQVVKIVVAVLAVIGILSILVDRSPVIFLSGLGAMTAVILLIFRDTILSLVASLQISGNDLVRVGDWIEMPQFGADGDVIDVALHTVKVQNWDKTITTIPTHRLISDPFKNWRFMSLSGGRRIKNSLHVDLGSVRFLESEEIEELSRFVLLRDYIERKRAELREHNQRPGLDPSVDADIRRLTNLGTFRAYMELYLRANKEIHPDMTLMVRQLASGPTGIPLEVYCFTRTTDWAAYEGILADLCEHFLAIAPRFGLRAFQQPAGADLASLHDSPTP
ncbi:MAG: mechanosensitive ion channel domain-containing protein [Myxococcota bacterium]